MGTFMLIVGILGAVNPSSATQTGLNAKSIAAVLMIYGESASYNLSWGPVSWVYLGEIFPNRIREVGIAIGAAAQWLFNFMLSQITPHAVDNLGWKTFIMFAVFNYALVVYAYFILKEVGHIHSSSLRFWLTMLRPLGKAWSRWMKYLEQRLRNCQWTQRSRRPILSLQVWLPRHKQYPLYVSLRVVMYETVGFASFSFFVLHNFRIGKGLSRQLNGISRQPEWGNAQPQTLILHFETSNLLLAAHHLDKKRLSYCSRSSNPEYKEKDPFFIHEFNLLHPFPT